jgi:hypothetical protein
MALKWIAAKVTDMPRTCAYCHKAVQPGETYRMGTNDSQPTTKVAIHKSCYEVK